MRSTKVIGVCGIIMLALLLVFGSCSQTFSPPDTKPVKPQDSAELTKSDQLADDIIDIDGNISDPYHNEDGTLTKHWLDLEAIESGLWNPAAWTEYDPYKRFYVDLQMLVFCKKQIS